MEQNINLESIHGNEDDLSEIYPPLALAIEIIGVLKTLKEEKTNTLSDTTEDC